MLYSKRFLLAIGLFIVSTSALKAADLSASDARRVTEVMAQFRVPALAVAQIKDGRVRATGYFGRDASGRAIDAESVFNVASLTKPMFALLWLQAGADSEVSLDAPLHPFWVDPDVQDDERHRALTARLLLSHQGGLPNWRGRGALKFLFAPGERIEYSGEGFEYLRRALEAHTGRGMAELMQQHVTGPLGMKHTFFGWDAAFSAHFTGGFDETGAAIDLGGLQGRAANAACCTFTTLRDYAAFAAWVADGARGVDRALFAQMQTVQARQAEPAEFFGLGWRLLDADGALWLSHDGREDGVRTYVAVQPASGDGLVILTPSNNGELVVRPLLRELLKGGRSVARQMDLDTWRYMHSVPPEQQAGMLGFIARSPSFTSKALHAVHSALIVPSKLSAKQKKTAAQNIERAVQGLQQQRIEPQAVADLLLQLNTEEGDATEGFRLPQALSTQRLERWCQQLEDLLAVK